MANIDAGEIERVVAALGGGALVVYGLSRRSPSGLALSLLGGVLAYRGMTGEWPMAGARSASSLAKALAPAATTVEKSTTIARSPEDLYHYWRNFDNLPCFMKHLTSVRCIDDRRSHWVATAPAGTTVEWDAEITEDRPNELIAWRSLEGADVYNAGSVRFKAAPGERGTEIHVRFEYAPPGGVIGAIAAKLFGEEPSQQVEGDLRRLKQMLEAGELATIDGQPTGRRSLLGRLISQENARSDEDMEIYRPAQPADSDRQALADRAFEHLAATNAPPAERSSQPAAAPQEGEPPKKPVLPKKPVVQKTSEDSFPASDPPAWTSSGDDEEREVAR